MSALFFLPPAMLIALPVLIAITIILEIYLVIYSLLKIYYNPTEKIWSFYEILFILNLCIITVISAQIIYNFDDGFYIFNQYVVIRYVVAAITLVTGIYLLAVTKEIKSLIICITVILTTPVAESAFGEYFSILLLGLIIFWIFRALYLLVIYRKNRNSQLSIFSIKEAMDAMNFGLLFYRNNACSNGQIILCNNKMAHLISDLTGRNMHNGHEIYLSLLNNKVVPQCKKYPSDKIILYKFPDNKIWAFELRTLTIKRRKYSLLIASDDTEIYHKTEQLNTQNAKLIEQNSELKEMLQNIEEICRIEETVHMKSKIHDLLGQKITILLRAMREHQPINKEMLSSISSGLSEALNQQINKGLYSMKMLVEDFKGLGVNVNFSGEMPDEDSVQKVFFEVATEAMTNAVRHGYANEIYIESFQDQDSYILRIRNNGLCPHKPIHEGGGFNGMRHKVQLLGGSFEYEISPEFTISITIPKGDLK